MKTQKTKDGNFCCSGSILGVPFSVCMPGRAKAREAARLIIEQVYISHGYTLPTGGIR